MKSDSDDNSQPIQRSQFIHAPYRAAQISVRAEEIPRAELSLHAGNNFADGERRRYPATINFDV